MGDAADLEKEREEKLSQVREYISAASQILNSLGTDFSRMGWMLEDMMMYIEEADQAEGEAKAETKTKAEAENYIVKEGNQSY